MSIQAIIPKTNETIQCRVDDTVADMAESLIVESYFGMGSGYDRRIFREIDRLENLLGRLCEDSVGVANLIKERLNVITFKCE